MSLHRSSYKKTTILAAAVGTISLFLCGVILFAQASTIPWTSLTFVFPPFIVWGCSLILLAVALFSYAVAIGGILALYNDAKGRAYF